MLKPRVAEKGASSAKLHQSIATKRPPNNPDVPKTIIEMLNHDFGAIKEMLDNFAQHL